MPTTAPSVCMDVLILNTCSPSNLPMITNADGKQETLLSFTMGANTQVDRSCSMTWKGEHYVFGGDDERRQVSKIVGCELRNIGKF